MLLGSEKYLLFTIDLIVCHIDLRQNSLWKSSVFSVILAVIWADSCGKRTSRRLQAKAVPAESVHKKTANKVGDFVDSLKELIHLHMDKFFFLSYFDHAWLKIWFT